MYGIKKLIVSCRKKEFIFIMKKKFQIASCVDIKIMCDLISVELVYGAR